MTIGTAVFRRIVEQHKDAAVEAVIDTMKQTVRYGGYDTAYLRRPARELVEAKLNDCTRA